jgi:hypothetical protein
MSPLINEPRDFLSLFYSFSNVIAVEMRAFSFIRTPFDPTVSRHSSGGLFEEEEEEEEEEVGITTNGMW